jgi:hypothetical protein
MGRYHVVGIRSLPRFVRGRPAVRRAARPGDGPCPVSRGTVSFREDAPYGVRRMSVAGQRVEEDRGLGPGRGWFLRVAAWLGNRLGRRRNPFFGVRPRLASTVTPQPPARVFEGVKVLRNDLSDTDFEVVRPRGQRGVKGGAVSCDFGAVEAGGGGESRGVGGGH